MAALFGIPVIAEAALDPHPAFIVPFAALLLCIATMPLLLSKFWEHHYKKIALGLSAVSITASGAFSSTNEFIVRLSDRLGGFPGGGREIGRLSGAMGPGGSIHALIPKDVLAGTHYRIRVDSTDEAVIGTGKCL